MAKTVTGLIDDARDARDAIDELEASGVPRDDVSVVASDRSGASSAASRALTAAGVGAALSGIAGFVVGLSSFFVPGFGPLLAAGPIASALKAAALGAAAGGLTGALVRLGVPEEEANCYAEGVRRGGNLITMRIKEGAVARTAVRILHRHNMVDISERVAAWRRSGWTPQGAQTKRMSS